MIFMCMMLNRVIIAYSNSSHTPNKYCFNYMHEWIIIPEMFLKFLTHIKHDIVHFFMASKV